MARNLSLALMQLTKACQTLMVGIKPHSEAQVLLYPSATSPEFAQRLHLIANPTAIAGSPPIKLSP